MIHNRFFGNTGSKHNTVTHGDSGLGWKVYPSSMTDEDIRADWARFADPDGWQCSHEHDCCGCVQTSEMWVRRQGRRAVARQMWGRNV